MKLTDTHCHLDFDRFDEDRGAVIQRARDTGVGRILIPTVEITSSIFWLIKFAQLHNEIYLALGYHPTNLNNWKDASINNLRLFSETDKVVAIGEIGLDYYWVKDVNERAFQRKKLKEQLAVAKELDKPVIIHMREEGDAWSGAASNDLLEILAEWQSGLTTPLGERPGVLHSFNGDLETAQKALALNFYIGITGPVTYKNADKKREIVRQLPLDKILVETDAPFLAPVPHRGKRNEPAYVLHIADKIAEIHSKSPAEVAAITTSNATRLFAWGD